MSEPKELVWGETPFDGMSREELDLFAKRALRGLMAATSVLRMTEMADPYSPYWTEGVGGRTLADLQFIARSLGYADMAAVDAATYRAYYRAAIPLLFAGATLPNGSPTHRPRWICDECDRWVEISSGDVSHAAHAKEDCSGTWRPMTLADLRL